MIETRAINAGHITIRDMVAEDLKEVLSIERVSFPTPWTGAMFLEELMIPVCHDLVAVAAERIVGYISFAIIVDEVHIRNIAVHEKWKRTGIATLLLDEMIRSSLDNGVVMGTLEVRKSNKVAIELYKKFGFMVKGIRPLYYTDTKEDALILWADLRAIAGK